MSTDKLNQVDFQWFIVRTQPRQEATLVDLLTKHQQHTKNILEVYRPTHTTVNIHKNGKEEQTGLFSGFVFVLATRKALADFLEQRFPGGVLLYDYSQKTNERKAPLLTIPEEQLRNFRDFNENYADKVIVLERPYADYAFNAKTHEPNEIVRVVDGPLAGREGYICKFRRDKRLVFQMHSLEKGGYLTVSLPHVWNFHVVRLHNAEGDRLSMATEKERAADLLIGMLQACGYGEQTSPMFHHLIERLSLKPSLVQLCKDFAKQDEALSRQLSRISTDEAELLLNLARYEHDNPGYVRTQWNRLLLRPFLTPTSGPEIPEEEKEIEYPHQEFTEIIRRVEISEQVYYPSKQKGEERITPYYAHIGRIANEEGYTFFANWDRFLGEYFLTGDKANEKLVSGEGEPEKLIASFRNYAPTFYKVLTDECSPIKAIPQWKVGNDTLNVMVTTSADKESGKNELIETCLRICQEINSTTHLALWRRYLRTVWLHR